MVRVDATRGRNQLARAIRWNKLTTKAVIKKQQQQTELESMSSLPSSPSTSSGGEPRQREDQMKLIRLKSRPITMKWSKEMESPECVVSHDQQSVLFHPNQADSTTVCMAQEPLKRTGCYYYWEVRVLDKAYGTSVMFGLCTRQQMCNKNEYCNLIGLDEHGWSLSHKGLVWHAGTNRPYTRPFPAETPVVVGMEYNTMSGQLSYYMNGRHLGVAFFGLNEINEDLYPCVGSTAKNTAMVLLGAYCGRESLFERTCFKLLSSSSDHVALLEHLENNYRLPSHLVDYLRRAATSWSKSTASTIYSQESNGDEQQFDQQQRHLNSSLLDAHQQQQQQQQQQRQQLRPLEPPLVPNLYLQYED